MSSYQIDIQKNIIKYKGETFKLSEIKTILKNTGAEMFISISCPNEIKYVLTEEAKSVMSNLAGKDITRKA
jgi:hypothetical protein